MQKIIVLTHGALTSLIQSIQYKPAGAVEIVLIDALLEKALTKAQTLERKSDVDVFVSAGGNATLLAPVLHKSFVPIKVTGFDILNALKKAAGFAKRIGIVTHQSKTHRLDDFKDVLTIKPLELTYDRLSDVDRALDQLQAQGIDTVIGASLVVEAARCRGMRAIMIYSRDGVTRALDEAVQIAISKNEERAKKEELKTILDFAHGGIMATDKNGIIKFFNPQATRITGIPGGKVVERHVDAIFPHAALSRIMDMRKPEIDIIQSIGKATVVSSCIPIVVNGTVTGSVTVFQNTGSIQKAERKIRENLYQKGFFVEASLKDIIGSSSAIERVKSQAYLYAATESTILLEGESGTGKELFAKGIHAASARSKGPFVAINCGAFPETLLESELFGYREGAFTGARRGGKPGLFELAHGGTIFLDEVAELPFHLQPRLLRVLEERKVMRIGDDRIIPVDIRVIAATNKKLRQMMLDTLFREDLYYRLNVLAIDIPPLSDRQNDIGLLAYHFLKEFQPALTPKQYRTIVNDPALSAYTWPGNVRELRNIMERIAVLYHPGTSIHDLIISLLPKPSDDDAFAGTEDPVAHALRMTGGNKARAAKALGISRTTLWRRLRNAEDLEKNRFTPKHN